MLFALGHEPYAINLCDSVAFRHRTWVVAVAGHPLRIVREPMAMAHGRAANEISPFYTLSLSVPAFPWHGIDLADEMIGISGKSDEWRWNGRSFVH